MGGFRENRIGSSFLTIWARQCDLTPLSAPPKIQPLSWSSWHTLGSTESGQLRKARCGGTASQTHLAFGTVLAPDVSLRGLGKRCSLRTEVVPCLCGQKKSPYSLASAFLQPPPAGLPGPISLYLYLSTYPSPACYQASLG